MKNGTTKMIRLWLIVVIRDRRKTTIKVNISTKKKIKS